ncbi:MAG: hypothetical protein K0Q76_113 [Panacagrimonas sp.]|nr:GNAT family N-acetyltransferase [Panacagrimonas sp.]MCC2655005.1 hypothetical protein [Panacagrimonas sp.]
MESVAAEWDALEAQISPRLPFRGAWWNILWWRHFHENRLLVSDALRVFTVRDASGSLLAVFPMMLTSRPGRGYALHRMMQFFGSDPNLTEVRGPICRRRDQARAIVAVSAALTQRGSEWDEVQWSGLRPDRETRGALESVPGVRWTDPLEVFYLDLPSTWEEFKRTRSRNIKESLRKCYNSLKRDELACSLQVVETVGQAPDALDEFLQMHAMRAARQDTVQHPNVFASEVSKSFLRDYAAYLASIGGLRLFRLEVAGETVATRLGFQLGNELYLSFSGYRPEWAPYSVATTLVAEVLQWAIAQGLGIVNLSAGRDASKTRWGPSVVSFERAGQRSSDPSSAWRRRIYRAARDRSRDDRSWPGRWLATLRRNRFGAS